jgi:hypothetical protein
MRKTTAVMDEVLTSPVRMKIVLATCVDEG